MYARKRNTTRNSSSISCISLYSSQHSLSILYSRFSWYSNSDEVANLADRLVRPAPTKTTFWRNQNATQYIHWLIYWLAIVRQRKEVSPAKCYLLNRQWICILPGPSRPSAETNQSRFGVGLGLIILTPNMATSRSTSRPELRLHCQSLFLYGPRIGARMTSYADELAWPLF